MTSSYAEMDGSYKQVRWAKAIVMTFIEKAAGRDPLPQDDAVLGCTDPNLLIDNRDLLEVGDSKGFCDAVGAQWQDWTPHDAYHAKLVEHYRSPSKGGNTSALHSHAIIINNMAYFFLARGARKWAYKGDTVRFIWYPKEERRIILKGTFQVRDRKGDDVVRGDRRAKPVQRSAEQRAPASRREMRR